MVRYILYFLGFILLVGVVIFLFPDDDYPSDEITLTEGKELFMNHCISCHGLQSDGIGPPLGGITGLLSKKALLEFIDNPDGQIKSGSERAVALHRRYKLMMPSFSWMKESQIISILAYIHNQGATYNIAPLPVTENAGQEALTGRLVPPVKPSGIRIILEDVVQLPLLGSSTDLGVVTLRAHPSGDGTLFASDQHGVVYRIRDGNADIYLDLRKEVRDFQSGPGIATGAGSFDFHPDFLNNGLLYISHAESYKGQTADYAISDTLKSEVQWVIGEWKVDDINSKVFSGTRRELLRLHAPNFAHGCQEIAFVPGLKKNDPDYGLLYIGYGDGGSNNIKHPELGHHLKSFLGTIMRIDPLGSNSRNGHYGIPSGNPFVNEADPWTVKEIYAYGFRNPHHVSWDIANGNRMLVSDIGEANIEELNVIGKGGDYGWPNREGDFGIATLKDMKSVFRLTESERDLFKAPFAQYDHEEGNAISGGYVYGGDLTPLQNKYVFGDIVNGRLFYVNIDQPLSDSAVYELTVTRDGKETTLQELSHTKRLHLRIAYDQYQNDLYVITKADGMIRRVIKAF